MISWLSAAYVFVGIALLVFVVTYGWLAVSVAIALWIANLFLLRYANRRW